MKSKQIDRREALRRTAWIMGGAVTAPTMLGIMNGCSVTNDPNWEPTFFDKNQAVTIMDITDIIIPTTDTPGAVEVGVPKFIESMVSEIYTKEDQEDFLNGLKDFQQSVKSTYGDSFVALEMETKILAVTALNASAVGSSSEKGSKEHFYMKVKELTVGGFCMSEVGATQVLKYDKTPGEYKGCIPFEEVGKTWAT